MYKKEYELELSKKYDYKDENTYSIEKLGEIILIP